MELTPNKSQHLKLALKKKIVPPLLSGFELTTIRLRVRRSDQQAATAGESARGQGTRGEISGCLDFLF